MVNKLKIQCLKMDERVSALGSRLETSMAEMRAALFCGNPNNTTIALHPTPVQDATHIKVELIGQRKEDVKTLAAESQRKYSPLFLANSVLETAPLLPSQEGVKPHAYDSQPKELVTLSAENKTDGLYPTPAADDATKPEILPPTPEGQRHPFSPPPPQPLPLARPQQPPLHNMELVPQPTPVPAAIHHLQLFSSFHILYGLPFCTLLSSLKHETAPPWLISTIALRARLFRE